MAVNMANRLNVTRVFNISNEAENHETDIVRLDRIPSQTNLVYKWINVANYSNYPVMIYETQNPSNQEPICIIPPVSMISFEIPDTTVDQVKYVFTIPVENPNYTFITNGTKYTCMVIYSLENLGWNYASGIQMINETNQNYYQDTQMQEALLNQQQQITQLLESLENQTSQIKQNTQGNINSQTGLYFYYPLNIAKIRVLAQNNCATIVSDTNFQFDFTINQTQFELLCNNWFSSSALSSTIGNGKVAFAQNVRVEKYVTPATITEDVTSEHLELYIHSPYNTNPVTQNTSNPITIDNGTISTAADKFLFDYNNPSYQTIIPDAQNPTAFALNYSIMSASTSMLDTNKVFMGIRGTLFPAEEAMQKPIIPPEYDLIGRVTIGTDTGYTTTIDCEIGIDTNNKKVYINSLLQDIVITTQNVYIEHSKPVIQFTFETATNTGFLTSDDGINLKAYIEPDNVYYDIVIDNTLSFSFPNYGNIYHTGEEIGKAYYQHEEEFTTEDETGLHGVLLTKDFIDTYYNTIDNDYQTTIYSKSNTSLVLGNLQRTNDDTYLVYMRDYADGVLYYELLLFTTKNL